MNEEELMRDTITRLLREIDTLNHALAESRALANTLAIQRGDHAIALAVSLADEIAHLRREAAERGR